MRHLLAAAFGVCSSISFAIPVFANNEWPAFEQAELLKAQSSIHGFVQMPDGTPAADVHVATSSGVETITSSDGGFVLNVELGIDAKELVLTARTVSETSGSSLALKRTIAPVIYGATWVGTLELLPVGPCTPSWIPTFRSVPGVNNDISALASFDDGSGRAIYAGGAFTQAAGKPLAYIAKWNGSRWFKLGRGLDGPVTALAVHDDGTGPALYAAGAFTKAGGAVANGVAKWDGSTWSNLGLGITGPVAALLSHNDGNGPGLFATGNFTTADGVVANGISKWNGVSWETFGVGLNGAGTSMAVYDSGSGPELYLGGYFRKADGILSRGIIRWDGANWISLGAGVTGFASGGPTKGYVSSLAVYDFGTGAQLYVAGSFIAANGVSANRIAKWDGANFTPVGAGVDSGVHYLAVYDDGTGPELYAGGSFSSGFAMPAGAVAKWNGTSWSSLGSGLDGTATSFAVLNAGNTPSLFVGGTFTTAGGLAANRIAEWDNTSWRTLGSGVSSVVSSIAVADDGSGKELFLGGNFTGAGPTESIGVTKWDGQDWTPLASGLSLSSIYYQQQVGDFETFDDGTGPAVYAGGYFTAAGGIPDTTGIARWDGTNWSAVGSGLSSANVWALETFDDGTGEALYAGGFFSAAGAVPLDKIGKWDGSTWSTLVSTNTTIRPIGVVALQVFDDGSGPALFAGGSFSSTGGTTSPDMFLAKWDGTDWLAVGHGLNSPSYCLAVFDDGTGPALYIGGQFTASAQKPVLRIARWDGSTMSQVGGGTNNTVYALEVMDDGAGPGLFVGGKFSKVNGIASGNLAKWTFTGWSTLGRGVHDTVRALCAYDDGGGPLLYVGGEFTSGPTRESYLTRWGCRSSNQSKPSLSTHK